MFVHVDLRALVHLDFSVENFSVDLDFSGDFKLNLDFSLDVKLDLENFSVEFKLDLDLV